MPGQTGEEAKGRREHRGSVGERGDVNVCARPLGIPPSATDSRQCTRAFLRCSFRFGRANGSRAERPESAEPRYVGASSIIGANPCAQLNELSSSATAGRHERMLSTGRWMISAVVHAQPVLPKTEMPGLKASKSPSSIAD